jgi:hypothetical protein
MRIRYRWWGHNIRSFGADACPRARRGCAPSHPRPHRFRSHPPPLPPHPHLPPPPSRARSTSVGSDSEPTRDTARQRPSAGSSRVRAQTTSRSSAARTSARRPPPRCRRYMLNVKAASPLKPGYHCIGTRVEETRRFQAMGQPHSICTQPRHGVAHEDVRDGAHKVRGSLRDCFGASAASQLTPDAGALRGELVAERLEHPVAHPRCSGTGSIRSCKF